MKYLRFLLIIGLITSTVACKKSRYPEVENSANAQFTRVITTTPVPPAVTPAADYNSWTLSKATPALNDKFTLKMVESGNVKSVSVVVDYRKSTSTTVTTFSQPFATITSWPQDYTVSLNSIVALFAANGLTATNLAVGDRFVFRVIVTLNSGTVISEQAAIMNSLPYAITLTYRITA
jgi:hypothetical protein